LPYRAPELFNIPSQIAIDERSDVWSLGCVLFALCFYKSPYDIVYERNDSVALAIVSGKIDIPQDSPFFSDGMHDLIRYILVLDHTQRPFLQDVLQKVKELEMKNEGCV
jgi:serine/threonine kinase 16